MRTCDFHVGYLFVSLDNTFHVRFMLKTIIAFFLTLSFSICHIYGQPYYFRNYQVEDGLTSSAVLCSMQDSRGFLWFGTKDGLNRFDGYSFKSFQQNSKVTNGIGRNFIHSIVEDSFQNIWVGTSNGLYRYDPVFEKFTLLEETKKKNVIEVTIDRKGNIWFITGHNLFRYHIKSDAIQSYQDKIGFASSIVITGEDELWVASGEGYLGRYRPSSDSFERHHVYTHSAPTLTNWIPVIRSGGKHTILVGTQSQGLKVFHTKDFTYEDVLSLNPDRTPIYVRDIMHYQEDEYWLATESGIFIYDLKKGLKEQLRKDRNDPFSLSDNAVYTLTKDKEGGVWAGTYFGGVNYYIKENTFFQKIFSRAAGNALKNNAVRELCVDQYGSMWIGTEDAGLVKYEPKLDKFTAFLSDGKKGSISHNNIHGLVTVKDELWIGTFEQGLDVMDIKTGKVIRNYKAGGGNFGSNFIESLHLTKDKELYIGSSSGLYRYQREQDDFVKIDEIPSVHLLTIIEDQEGTLWLAASNNGVYSYHPKTGVVGSLKHDESNPNSLLNNYTNDLTIDSKGNLWITSENGLSKYNLKDKKFTHLSSLHNFPSNVFYKVLEDENKGIWITTAKGLIQLNPTLDKWKLYTKSNGLLNDQFNYKSGYKAADGSFYFGSVKGLIRFNPNANVSVPSKSPVYFTGFQVSNQELEINNADSPLKKSILLANSIVLKPHQSTFSIDFAALSYASPQMTEYAYRMKGVEDDWVYLKTNRKVYFTNVSPGNYLFEVKATTNGEWGDEVSVLQINIKPPFWASNVAFLFYFLFIVTVAYLIHKFNLRRLYERNQRKFTLFESRKEREIYRAKLQFFTNITHEIRTPLTLIQGPLEAVMKDFDQDSKLNSSLKIIKKNTDRLVLLTDQLLNFRKAEADNVTLSFVKVDICALVNEIFNLFLPLARSQDYSFKTNLPEEGLVAMADEEALRKIISNLFSNAIKYAEGNILVDLIADVEESSFKLMVKTDGKKIPLEYANQIFEPFFRLKESESQSGTGIGLALARSLAELHGGKLTLCAPEDHMNVFVLEIPIQQNGAYESFDEPLKSQPEKPFIHLSEDKDLAMNETLELKLEVSRNKANKKDLTVLVVEDNVEIVAFISRVLMDDFHIIQAMNGEEAISAIKENTVNLVISDIMMPVMDGYDVCRFLKSNPDYSHIPIILLSAKGSIESKVDGLGAGADVYIEKPFSPQYLRAQIDSLLSNRERIRTYFASSPLVHIKTMAYSAADSMFLESLNEVIDKNIDNTSLDVEQLAWFMNMSRPTLYRKIKAICELSPSELITLTRLKKAAQLLAETDYTITKIAIQVGFGSQTQFVRNFIKQFGISPSKYRTGKVKRKAIHS